MAITFRGQGSGGGKKRSSRPGRYTGDELLQCFEITSDSGDGQHMAVCPAHDDKRGSLSINVAGRKALLYCQAGCGTSDVVAAVGLTVTDLNLAPSNPASKQTTGVKSGGAKVKSHSSTKARSWGEIVTEYNYEDENGDLRFQVCRLEPKDFRQRRPDGSGGWTWNMRGVELVPYRLPELIAATAGETVHVVEGEKDADALAEKGLIATCNPGGAGKWREEYCQYFRGKNVVVLPDNDDAGWKHAVKVAASLTGIAKSIKIVQLDGVPEKGDIFDWFAEGHTLDDLKRLVSSTDVWSPDSEDIKFQPFPTDRLPAPIARYVREASRSLGCDEAYMAVPLLPVCATAIGNSRRIQLKKDWCEPSVIWAAIVGDSGTLKSPALDLLLEPIHRRQHSSIEPFEVRKAEYERAKAERERRLKRNSPPDLADLIPLEQPVLQRLLCGDTTVEALSLLLGDQPRGMLMFRDELSGWMASFDAYKPSAGGDEAHWLSMHRAGPLIVDRKTDREVISVPRAAVSVTGGIQPQVLARVLEPRHFESGLAARLLFAYPPKPLRRWTDEEISDEARVVFESVIDRLYALEPDLAEGVHDVPRDLPLTEAGRIAWIAFFNEHAQEQFLIGGDAAAAWSKLEGYAARIALVIHCIRAVIGDETLESCDQIDEQSVEAGVAIVRWFGREAIRVYQIVRPDKAVEHASRVQELLALMRRNGGRMTASGLARASRRFGKNSEEAESWLKVLIELGLARCAVVKTKGRPRVDYVLDGPPAA